MERDDMTDGLSKLTGWDIGSVGVGRGEGGAFGE